ncbi:zinc finger and BTB domain-containing protein 38 [Kryptolebias marmoratus]|uniref:zinc finger and BTB domain-containing protein 38 n=1 Tax=Kryptolebias marmoratus TaxID=37003 RepID=UPI0007F8CE4E|nr:zinc finger and BTB domain-containing protein 38 [Kryptolebias marmoratus]XP_017279465.1 zinc finger and BTB domain-containing protein 38 [Kryptolebias marmoratus]
MDSTHPCTVLSKLNEQRSQGLFCDVTIVVEDVKFRAHKNILAACSGYFKSTLLGSDTCSSSQVLELMDLRSEVFANILNFIYCSKVTALSADDTRGLVAAGKRLGIPFLERLTEEKQDECVASTDFCTALGSGQTKKEASRPEEIDGTRGPRITNAFSINEVSLGNNPFTSLDHTDKEQQLPDVGELPSDFSTTSCINGSNEPSHTLFEHSYAVSKSTDGKESSQWDNNKAHKPLQSKQLIYRNSGPLKKRHRLRGIFGRSILSRPAELETDKLNSVTSSLSTGDSETPATIMTPSSLFSEAETEKQMDTGLSAATDEVNMELGPPPLSPHTEDSILIYSCEQCTEIFPNKALLTIHAEVHRKHFVSHLFCKFCCRKFIHLKRLHNHEQVCPSALRGPPKLDPRDTSAKDVDQDSDDLLDVESIDTQPPPADLSDPYVPESAPLVQSAHQQNGKTAKLGVGQRRYNCSVCKRVYVTLSSLKRHENVHSWQRAYPCHYCNKVFALAEYRTKHEIWHTGERRYQCIFCLETFMTYYILKNHQKSFHGIDPNLSVKKKSANGGLKASVYPIKLYRLLPMKFRKRQYKTYSQTYSEHTERTDPSSLDSNSLIPPFEENGLISHADATSFPLTFMATTKIVSPVVPRICFNKPSDRDMDQSPNSELEVHGSTRQDVENRDPSVDDCDRIFSVHPSSDITAGYNNDPPMIIDSDNIARDVSFLNSLSTVKKLGELSASAKRVEEMTKEILQSTAENPMCDKIVETYIAKPACQGPSLESDSMPLCQITVKIGNEAIIRRQIKGSKLFPRKKRRARKLSGKQSPSQSSPTRENSESPRLRFRPEISASAGPEAYDDANDCDTADELWRPYYSYKAKKKRNKLKYKHSRAMFHQYPDPPADRTSASEAHLDRTPFPAEERNSGGSGGVKHSLGRNHGPRATYNCDICDSSFITETGLKAHVIGSHPYFCRICGKQGPPGEAPVGGDYICRSCMENGSCFDDTPRSPNPEKKYRCSFCPQRFLYLATKKSHEKRHQTENRESYRFNTFTSSSKYSAHPKEDSKQGAAKTEDADHQEGKIIKSESVEGEYFSSEGTLKIKDATDFQSLTTFQDVSNSGIKRPLSPYSDSLPSLASSRVKHKFVKKRINVHHSMHLLSKKQVCDGGDDGNKMASAGPGVHSHEKPGKLFGRNDSDSNGPHISVHKPEKWVCKEEPFF